MPSEKRLATSLKEIDVRKAERDKRDVAATMNHRRNEAALRGSEERFREIAETVNEVFWITDPLKLQML